MNRISGRRRLLGLAAVGLIALAVATGAQATATATYDNSDCLSFSIVPSGPDFVLVCTLPAAPPGTFETNVGLTIEAYYTNILGRPSDAGGKTYWAGEVTRLKNLGAGVTDVFVAMGVTFFNSAEYRAKNTSDSQYVTDLYKAFFGRDPDPAGLAYWVSQLTGGYSRGALLNSVLFSGEYVAAMQARFGVDATMRAEVAMVLDYYRGLLGRLPEDGGFNSWVRQFRTAQCAGAAAVTAKASEISAAFVASPEYAIKNQGFPAAQREPAYVADLYNAFMKRGGDLNGFLYWVNELQQASRTRDNVRSQFVGATEFQTRVAAVIAQGCLAP